MTLSRKVKTKPRPQQARPDRTNRRSTGASDKGPLQIVFTDLDGSLLHRETYSIEDAQPALELLKRRNVPLVFVSSKTRAEIEYWRIKAGNFHPFVVENGGAIVIPEGYFDRPSPRPRPTQQVEVVALGVDYPTLVAELNRASKAVDCPVEGFSDMTPERIASELGLSLEQARLAKQREFDEPFRILNEDRAGELFREIGRAGLSCSAGGRLFHVFGRSDKGTAVGELIRRYEAAWGPLRTIGLGDGMNDLPMLQRVSVAVIVRSETDGELTRYLPHALLSAETGPAGWNEAVQALVGHYPGT